MESSFDIAASGHDASAAVLARVDLRSYTHPTSPRAVESLHSGLRARWLDGRPVPAPNSRRRNVHQAVKRMLDILVAMLALFVLAPLLFFVAVAIRLSDGGPVFFRQKRVGLNGDIFEIFKFRSMSVAHGDVSGVRQTVAGDQRVTRMGAFLRRTSIDELPQLFNILRGEMSLVGPRPHVPGMIAVDRRYDEFVPYYDYRNAVLPGLTGWAQANGFRGVTDSPMLAQSRIEHDVAYIQNFSVWLDIRIILITLRREFLTGSGF